MAARNKRTGQMIANPSRRTEGPFDSPVTRILRRNSKIARAEVGPFEWREELMSLLIIR